MYNMHILGLSKLLSIGQITKARTLRLFLLNCKLLKVLFNTAQTMSCFGRGLHSLVTKILICFVLTFYTAVLLYTTFLIC